MFPEARTATSRIRGVASTKLESQNAFRGTEKKSKFTWLDPTDRPRETCYWVVAG